MSGGRFDYAQHKITDIADDIQVAIDNNDLTDIGGRYRDEVIARLNDAVRALRVAHVYAQRADWLMSGDDGEDSFIKRLADDLRDL